MLNNFIHHYVVIVINRIKTWTLFTKEKKYCLYINAKPEEDMRGGYFSPGLVEEGSGCPEMEETKWLLEGAGTEVQRERRMATGGWGT